MLQESITIIIDFRTLLANHISFHIIFVLCNFMLKKNKEINIHTITSNNEPNLHILNTNLHLIIHVGTSITFIT